MGWKFWQKKAQPVQPVAKRSTGFSAADYSRVTASLNGESDHIMRTLRYQGKALRARSRQVVSNTPYGAKFEQMVVSNICGPTPFRLQAKIKNNRGKFDTGANEMIESGWTAWGKPGACDFEGRLSFADVQRLIARILARDGEYLVRVWEGSQAGPFGLQLQVLDVDRLDEDKNEDLPNGNTIIAGVEVDGNGRTVAYHLLKRKPRDWQLGVVREYVRIPADQILHGFLPMYAEQVRGVPWMYAAILQLHRLGLFSEAAIIAAQVGASKMGFYQQRGGDQFAPDDAKKDARGNFVQDAEPGEFAIVPEGWEFKDWNPNYPDAQVGPFIKACLRGTASALGVSYHSLANDLEAVNFSSARAGVLEEREQWMLLQAWMVEHFHEQVYQRWLRNAILRRKLPFALDRMDKYQAVYFQPRRWQWVDPKKDVEANIAAIKWGLKSRTEVVAETGRDIEDVMDQLAMEKALAEEKGVAIAEEGSSTEPEEDMEDSDEEATV